MNDPKITGLSFSGLIEDIGEAECKAMPPGRRYRYSMAITYQIERMPEENSFMRHKTKKGLQQRIVDYTDYAKQGRLFAWYDSVSKRFIGTRLTF